MLHLNALKIQFYCFVFQLFSLYSCTDLYSDDVKSYDTKKFKQNVGLGMPHFINYFAPWCGYSKRLKPVWDEIALVYNTLTSPPDIVIAMVDCTIETPLCDAEGVISYPSLIFYPAKAKEGKKFQGKRDLFHLDQFIYDNLGRKKLKLVPHEDNLRSTKSYVPELSDDNFHDAVDGGVHFVKFHAPWCGHCQKLVKVWEELAFINSHDKSITISEVDCTVNKRTCDEFKIKGYPTLLWIVNGKMKETFHGERILENLDDFITRMKMRSKELAVTDDGKPDLIIGLTETNFAAEISSGITFVTFYAPWCRHSKRLKPIWKELAQKFLKHNNVKLGELDCFENEDICGDVGVVGYPSIFLFRNGKLITEYNGLRRLEHMHSFLHEYVMKFAHDEL